MRNAHIIHCLLEILNFLNVFKEVSFSSLENFVFNVLAGHS